MSMTSISDRCNRIIHATGQEQKNLFRRHICWRNADLDQVAIDFRRPRPELDAWLSRLGIGVRIPVADQSSLHKR
jgi:hypothetical protein